MQTRTVICHDLFYFRGHSQRRSTKRCRGVQFCQWCLRKMSAMSSRFLWKSCMDGWDGAALRQLRGTEPSACFEIGIFPGGCWSHVSVTMTRTWAWAFPWQKQGGQWAATWTRASTSSVEIRRRFPSSILCFHCKRYVRCGLCVAIGRSRASDVKNVFVQSGAR